MSIRPDLQALTDATGHDQASAARDLHREHGFHPGWRCGNLEEYGDAVAFLASARVCYSMDSIICVYDGLIASV
ncbi:hypothetical protein ACFQX4_25995 [Roseomonas sp. GCM10028921]